MRGDRVKLIAVFLQQAFDVLLHAAHNIAGQGDLHELQHGDVVVVVYLCAIEALVVRAQVPKVGEYVVGPEDLMRSDLSGVTLEELASRTGAYTGRHNTERIKRSLGGMSPLQFRRSLGLAV